MDESIELPGLVHSWMSPHSSFFNVPGDQVYLIHMYSGTICTYVTQFPVPTAQWPEKSFIHNKTTVSQRQQIIAIPPYRHLHTSIILQLQGAEENPSLQQFLRIRRSLETLDALL